MVLVWPIFDGEMVEEIKCLVFPDIPTQQECVNRGAIQSREYRGDGVAVSMPECVDEDQALERPDCLTVATHVGRVQ